MSQEKANNFLETEKLGKLMRKFAIPTIISLLVGALYNIVDQIFIANASYLGSYGNAANTVVFPLTVVALAIAVMFGDGTCSFVSIALGAGENEKAHKGVGNAIVMLVASSIILTAVYLLFSDQIIRGFGGGVNEETFRQSKEYFFWITVGIPFYMFGQGMNPIIRSDGNPRFAMISTLAGAFLNIILDPVFIFIFKWGMMGAAVATVIGQVVTALLAFIYLFRIKSVKLTKKSFVIDWKVTGKATSLGICSFLSQISLVAAMAAINNMIRKYSAMDQVFSQPDFAQIPMAVVGIVMKFFQIVISIVVGMSAGCIPVAGYNLGAGRKDRASKLFKMLLGFEALVGFVALLIVELLPRQLIAIFGAANESVYYTQFAIKSFRIYLCMIILACVNKATFIYLQALGKALLSTLLSMVREIVFGVGFSILLPVWFGLDGVLYSMPVSDVLTFMITLWAVWYTLNALKTDGSKETAAASRTAVTGKPLTDKIICIGRSYGAGGRSVGRLVAEKLNIPFYDGELLEQAAEKSGLSRKYLESVDEKSVSMKMIYCYAEQTPDVEKIAGQAQREVIEKIASEGPCVIIGRRADKILKGRKIVSVFISADEEYRACAVEKMDSLDHDAALAKLRRIDRAREAYYDQAGEKQWGVSSNYDLCIDSQKVSFDKAADMIVSLA